MVRVYYFFFLLVGSCFLSPTLAFSSQQIVSQDIESLTEAEKCAFVAQKLGIIKLPNQGKVLGVATTATLLSVLLLVNASGEFNTLRHLIVEERKWCKAPVGFMCGAVAAGCVCSIPGFFVYWLTKRIAKKMNDKQHRLAFFISNWHRHKEKTPIVLLQRFEQEYVRCRKTNSFVFDRKTVDELYEAVLLAYLNSHKKESFYGDVMSWVKNKMHDMSKIVSNRI